MAMASDSGNYPRILLGPTGSDLKIEELARSLEADGCVVQTFSSMPVEVSLNKFDMAVLVVSADDAETSATAGQRIQRILHAAGFLEARLAPGRVGLLVEESVDQLEAPPIAQITYARDDPMASRKKLVSFLGKQYPHVERDLHQPVPIREQVQSSELRLGWAMLAIVLLIALIPLMLVIRSLGNDDTVEFSNLGEALSRTSPAGPMLNTGSDISSTQAASDGIQGQEAESDSSSGTSSESDGVDAGDDGAATADSGADRPIELLPTTMPGSSMDESAQAGSAPTTMAAPATTAAPTPSTVDNADSGQGQSPRPTLTPRNPATSGGAGGQGTGAGENLPAVCRIYTAIGLDLPGSVDCAGAGRLVIEGWYGPWHNDIAAVALSTGTVGTLYYEGQPSNTVGAQQALAVGTNELNREMARYGVMEVAITFNADGQHIHLFQSQAYGGKVATLTFTLDRP